MVFPRDHFDLLLSKLRAATQLNQEGRGKLSVARLKRWRFRAQKCSQFVGYMTKLHWGTAKICRDPLSSTTPPVEGESGECIDLAPVLIFTYRGGSIYGHSPLQQTSADVTQALGLSFTHFINPWSGSYYGATRSLYILTSRSQAGTRTPGNRTSALNSCGGQWLRIGEGVYTSLAAFTEARCSFVDSTKFLPA